jgi:hypothetical protein
MTDGERCSLLWRDAAGGLVGARGTPTADRQRGAGAPLLAPRLFF